jgi:uncharacterized membrane protein YgdD (TMEM256/DUF423 family)
MNKGKHFVIAGGISGFLAVALGAFGAHGLSAKLSPEMMEIYKTGVLYHLIHSVVILAIGLADKEIYFKPGLFFAAGVVLFSFSLYLYAVTAVAAFAIITPFGGLCFLIAWLWLAVNAARSRN